jgi:hypothetical protein
MSENRTRSSRRAFFLKGGAVLGTGVATAAGAAAITPDEQSKQLRQQLGSLEDREAIRQLHLAFMTFIENQRYEAAAALFDEQASGKDSIRELFATHSTYRQKLSQQKDAVTLSEDRLQAAATFHVDVEVCTPLEADCTAAEMARLQGNVADRRWEAGRFEAKYVKTRGEWKVASLNYLAS